MNGLVPVNQAAWSQRHSPAYTITPHDLIDRSICHCCGRLLSRQWHRDIWGCEPEDFGRVHAGHAHPESPYVDPTDERWYWRDERAAR